MSDPVKSQDRFLLWPLALTVGWALALMLISILPVAGYMLMVPMAAITLGAPSAAVVLFLAFIWLRQRAWRRFLSAIVFPVVTLVAFLNVDASRLAIRTGGEFIHFGVVLPFYWAEIAKLPTDQGPRLKYFNWEGWMSISFGVLYDESDEVEKHSTDRSAAWNARADKQLDCEIIGGMPLGGHFYLIELGC